MYVGVGAMNQATAKMSDFKITWSGDAFRRWALAFNNITAINLNEALKINVKIFDLHPSLTWARQHLQHAHSILINQDQSQIMRIEGFPFTKTEHLLWIQI